MKSFVTGPVISAFFLIFFPGVLFAQSSGLLQWIGPDMEKQEFQIRYHGHYSKEVETTQTNEKFQETRQVLSVTAPCFQDEKRQIIAVADAGVVQVDTDVRFPDTKDEFPGTLWDIRPSRRLPAASQRRTDRRGAPVRGFRQRQAVSRGSRIGGQRDRVHPVSPGRKKRLDSLRLLLEQPRVPEQHSPAGTPLLVFPQ